MSTNPKERNAFVTEGISADAFRIEARKRAAGQGITTTIHLHAHIVICSGHEHEVIAPDAIT